MIRSKADLQRAALSLQRFGPFRALFRLYYRLGAAGFAWSCRRASPEIQEIFLRRGQTSKGWVPGASDLDFAVVVEDLDDGRFAGFLERFWARYAGWKRLFPILGEVQIVQASERARLAGRAGLRLRDYGASPNGSPWRGRWECLAEALFSALNLLEQTYFESARGAGPDFGHKIAKGCLDVLRYAEASRSAQAALHPAGRLERRERIEAGRLKDSLSRPLALTREQARAACGRALAALDTACDDFIRDVGESLPTLEGGPRPSWDPPIANSEILLWRKRLRSLDQPQFPPMTGVFYDGMARWHVLCDVTDETTLARLFDHLESWHREDPAFRAPPWVVSKSIFQALLWTPHLGTPFFWLALASHVGPSGVAGRLKSRQPLGRWAEVVQWRMTADDFRLPPKDFVRYGLEQSLSELSLSLSLFARDGWGGDNAFRVFWLYSRLLSASLYLRAGLAHDPEDLDGLIARFAERFPEDFERVRGPLEEALASRPGELNSVPPAELFYRHLPGYRALLDGALSALPSSSR